MLLAESLDWSKVDGRQVERIQHGLIITRVPNALVRPGRRILTFEHKNKTKDHKWNIEVQIEPKALYTVGSNAKAIPTVNKE